MWSLPQRSDARHHSHKRSLVCCAGGRCRCHHPRAGGDPTAGAPEHRYSTVPRVHERSVGHAAWPGALERRVTQLRPSPCVQAPNSPPRHVLGRNLQPVLHSFRLCAPWSVKFRMQNLYCTRETTTRQTPGAPRSRAREPPPVWTQPRGSQGLGTKAMGDTRTHPPLEGSGGAPMDPRRPVGAPPPNRAPPPAAAAEHRPVCCWRHRPGRTAYPRQRCGRAPSLALRLDPTARTTRMVGGGGRAAQEQRNGAPAAHIPSP